MLKKYKISNFKARKATYFTTFSTKNNSVHPNTPICSHIFNHQPRFL